MSERIKELAKQAGIWRQHYDLGEESPAGLEKFAELIIGKCLVACSRAAEIRHFVPPTQEQVVLNCMREIERIFSGVE